MPDDGRAPRFAIALMAAGAIAMVLSAGPGRAGLSEAVAATTALLFAATAVWLHWPDVSGTGSGQGTLERTRNGAVVNAAVYGWAALSMAGMYYLTDLSWYHAYQYAIIFALAAGVTWLIARAVQGLRPGEPERIRRALSLLSPLAFAQGLGALGVAGALAWTGKLTAFRADWAANHVFFYGALALAAVSLSGLPGLRRVRQ